LVKIPHKSVSLTLPCVGHQFDYSTISDAILHGNNVEGRRRCVQKWRGCQSSELFRQHEPMPSLRMLNLRQEFLSQWQRFFRGKRECL